MSFLYNKVKDEILKDHAQNNYMQAYGMPLRDRYDVPTAQQKELKEIAKQLTDDNSFPYEVFCMIYNDKNYTNTVKMEYRPLQEG